MDLPFDPYALVQPKTKADYEALLDEALAELKNLNDLLDAQATHMELMQRLGGKS